MDQAPLGWLGILRLGLVQTALGAVVVLMTSTINRVMVVELALPATVPGALIALHYGVQILRPAWGHGSDLGGRRTPWIIAGMAMLSIGGFGAALATALAASHPASGVALAALSFFLVGMGVGAAGTSVLAMLAIRVAPSRRAAAATIVWTMMIFGFALTAPLAGHFLDPFSNMRLIEVVGCVAAIAFVVATLAVAGIETREARSEPSTRSAPTVAKPKFSKAFEQAWNEPETRRFAIFIFVSMLPYSAQELLIEPFAGLVFGMTPGATTQLAGVQHGGVLAGMLGVAFAASVIGCPVFGSLRLWTVLGCIGSAHSLTAIAVSGFAGPQFPLRAAIFALGTSNGVFAVAAIGSMMGLAGWGRAAREGTRMGLWGAAQAIAFGAGGLFGTIGVDVARRAEDAPAISYAMVFVAEASLFLVAAALANRVVQQRRVASSQGQADIDDRPVAAGA
jgi:BCD family chlorophyll transporter-like MFS transporter